MSHQHNIDSLSGKAQSLSQSVADSRVAKILAEMNSHYRELCHESENLLHKFDSNVSDHQEYHDALHDCQEWISSVKEKAAMFAEVTGDRYAVQNKLERLQVNRNLLTKH